MCGICGFTNPQENAAPILKAMCDVMAHRGPDGEGQYIDTGIALGHRRLSLIDLAGGNQPMVRKDLRHTASTTSPAQEGEHYTRGDYSLVFNGEIYNYKDLRQELEEEGWEFSTSSDTEVLLVSYLAWGEEMLNRLRGMFAFALYNRQTGELFCARDFFGIKPFYYTVQEQSFIFASEIKCILEHPAYERKLNTEALEQYLCYQFSVLDETFFKGIYKLPPAHCMTVGADGSIAMKRYWSPEYDFDHKRSFEDTVTAIDQAMQDSVRYHNVADVEVGSFLSSGIDSSYMAASLALENPSIKTFTVGFEEYQGERDEISWARELSETLHISNSSKHIAEDEYWDALPWVQWHMDEPSADPSAVALYFVDQEAAKQVKAVLSGEGADEFFGGYKIYQTPFSNARLSWMPRSILAQGAKVCKKFGIRGANYLERASKQAEDWYYTNANGVAFSPAERKRLLKDKPQAQLPQELAAPIYSKVASLDETTRMQYLDLHLWLVGDILLKTDKMSMAHSLESRVPFLDTEVWNIARTIPTRYKANATQTKIALREAALKRIPRAWAEKEKLGFPVPVVSWLRQDKYYNLIAEWFTGPLAQEFFNTDELMQLLDEHRAGKDNSRKIWIIYMFLLWYKIYFVDKHSPASI